MFICIATYKVADRYQYARLKTFMDLNVSGVDFQEARRSLSENNSFITDHSLKAFEIFYSLNHKVLLYCPFPFFLALQFNVVNNLQSG